MAKARALLGRTSPNDGTPKSRLRTDRRGQMHVIETFIGVMLILNALAYLGSITVPTTTGAPSFNQLHLSANDALAAADNLANSTGESTLAQWVLDDNMSAFTTYLNRSLPANTEYIIDLASTDHRERLFGTDYAIGGAVVASRMVLLRRAPDGFEPDDGPLYRVTLRAWFI